MAAEKVVVSVVAETAKGQEEEQSFRLKTSAVFAKVIKAWHAEFGVPLGSARFFCGSVEATEETVIGSLPADADSTVHVRVHPVTPGATTEPAPSPTPLDPAPSLPPKSAPAEVPPPPTSDRVVVTVATQSGSDRTECPFRLKRTALFSKVATAWAASLGDDPSSYKFLLRGRELGLEEPLSGPDFHGEEVEVIAIRREQDVPLGAAASAAPAAALTTGTGELHDAPPVVHDGCGVGDDSAAPSASIVAEAPTRPLSPPAPVAAPSVQPPISEKVLLTVLRPGDTPEDAPQYRLKRNSSVRKVLTAWSVQMGVDSASVSFLVEGKPVTAEDTFADPAWAQKEELRVDAVVQGAVGKEHVNGEVAAAAAAPVPVNAPDPTLASVSAPAESASTAAVAPAVSEKVLLTVLRPSDNPEEAPQYRLKRGSLVRKVLTAWSQQVGVDPATVTFSIEGRRMTPEDSLDQPEWRKKDELRVDVVQQAAPAVETPLAPSPPREAQQPPRVAADPVDAPVAPSPAAGGAALGSVAPVSEKVLLTVVRPGDKVDEAPQFRLKRGSLVRKVLVAWSQQVGLDPATISFTIEGRPMSPDDSLDQPEWNEKEELRVDVVQQGVEVKPDEKVSVTIVAEVGGGNSDIVCRMKRTIPFSKMMTMWCMEYGKMRENVRFVYGDHELLDKDCLASVPWGNEISAEGITIRAVVQDRRAEDTGPSSGTKRKSSKDKPTAPKKPATAYVLWSTAKRAEICSKAGIDPKDLGSVAREAGKRWGEMSDADKEEWYREAHELRKVYDKECADLGIESKSARKLRKTKEGSKSEGAKGGKKEKRGKKRKRRSRKLDSDEGSAPTSDSEDASDGSDGGQPAESEDEGRRRSSRLKDRRVRSSNTVTVRRSSSSAPLTKAQREQRRAVRRQVGESASSSSSEQAKDQSPAPKRKAIRVNTYQPKMTEDEAVALAMALSASMAEESKEGTAAEGTAAESDCAPAARSTGEAGEAPGPTGPAGATTDGGCAAVDDASSAGVKQPVELQDALETTAEPQDAPAQGTTPGGESGAGGCALVPVAGAADTSESTGDADSARTGEGQVHSLPGQTPVPAQ
mmetsp:Transcript_121572/g.278660  ORF Transcript_121572/g.278660 Transcript_121572/m.278660 type:complete len:1089 (-) Transcript_121572:203-3469(-)